MLQWVGALMMNALAWVLDPGSPRQQASSLGNRYTLEASIQAASLKLLR